MSLPAEGGEGPGWPTVLLQKAAGGPKGGRRKAVRKELLLQGEVFVMTVAGPDPRTAFPARCRWLPCPRLLLPVGKDSRGRQS